MASGTPIFPTSWNSAACARMPSRFGGSCSSRPIASAIRRTRCEWPAVYGSFASTVAFSVSIASIELCSSSRYDATSSSARSDSSRACWLTRHPSTTTTVITPARIAPKTRPITAIRVRRVSETRASMAPASAVTEKTARGRPCRLTGTLTVKLPPPSVAVGLPARPARRTPSDGFVPGLGFRRALVQASRLVARPDLEAHDVGIAFERASQLSRRQRPHAEAVVDDRRRHDGRPDQADQITPLVGDGT